MGKKTITVNVDISDWQLAKSKGINISEICRYALKYSVDSENSENPTKEELKAGLSSLEIKRGELKRQLSIIESSEAIKKSKEEEEELKERMAIYEAKKNHGFFRPLVEEDD